ncbi:hypothetical protein ACFTSF_13165 [Kribbella sp. NPDC056951]|uniref:hypothetical protein n=1 Tax=Kribbella sp. NPDC056951 TaxID=3345978 RepID=UPI00362CBBE2
MLKRTLPALGLFFLAPLVAEFVLGNIPITAIFAWFTLAPLYGGGAILIRELVRRRGWGYPSVVLLGLAYGVLEEGITTMSLFNPNYADQRLLDPGYIPALGMGAPWTVFVLGLHTVWSITVPIVLMESISRRPREPWLGRVGLTLYGALFVAGLIATTAFSLSADPFIAKPAQFAGVVVAIVVLIALAVRVGNRSKREAAHELVGGAGGSGSEAAGSAKGVLGGVPPVRLAGMSGLVLSSAWMLSNDVVHSAWIDAGVMLAIDVLAAVVLSTWSRRAGWTPRHSVAVAGGALLTYVWHAFPQSPIFAASHTADLIGNIVFGAAALGVLALALDRAHPTHPTQPVAPPAH